MLFFVWCGLFRACCALCLLGCRLVLAVPCVRSVGCNVSCVVCCLLNVGVFVFFFFFDVWFVLVCAVCCVVCWLPLNVYRVLGWCASVVVSCLVDVVWWLVVGEPLLVIYRLSFVVCSLCVVCWFCCMLRVVLCCGVRFVIRVMRRACCVSGCAVC